MLSFFFLQLRPCLQAVQKLTALIRNITRYRIDQKNCRQFLGDEITKHLEIAEHLCGRECTASITRCCVPIWQCLVEVNYLTR
jgi:hypothetical protein